MSSLRAGENFFPPQGELWPASTSYGLSEARRRGPVPYLLSWLPPPGRNRSLHVSSPARSAAQLGAGNSLLDFWGLTCYYDPGFFPVMGFLGDLSAQPGLRPAPGSPSRLPPRARTPCALGRPGPPRVRTPPPPLSPQGWEPDLGRRGVPRVAQAVTAAAEKRERVSRPAAETPAGRPRARCPAPPGTGRCPRGLPRPPPSPAGSRPDSQPVARSGREDSEDEEAQRTQARAGTHGAAAGARPRAAAAAAGGLPSGRQVGAPRVGWGAAPGAGRGARGGALPPCLPAALPAAAPAARSGPDCQRRPRAGMRRRWRREGGRGGGPGAGRGWGYLGGPSGPGHPPGGGPARLLLRPPWPAGLGFSGGLPSRAPGRTWGPRPLQARLAERRLARPD